MNIEQCPNCGGELKFNLKMRLYDCQRCGAIWSYKLNMEEGTMEWYEHFVADKPEGWDDWSQEQRMLWLNADRLSQQAERFIRKEAAQ